MPNPLRPIGRLIPADARGRLPRLGGPVAARPAAAARAVRAAVASWHPVDALVVRGSAVRGTWVDGASDLDVVMLSDTPWPDDVEDRLHANGTVEAARDGLALDAVCLTFEELHADPRARGLRFHLALCATTLWGRDVLSDLPEPRLGPDAMVHLPGVESWHRTWVRESAAPLDPDEARILCAWMAKRLVRSAFEGVMMEIGAYTRDLHPAAEAVAGRRPALGAPIRAAAAFAVSHRGDVAALDALVRRTMPALLEMRDAAPGRHAD